MKCPHCLVAFHDKPQTHAIEADIDGGWMVWWVRCPTCKKLVISLLHGKPVFKDVIRQILMSVGADAKLSMVYPKSASRPQCAKQVPKLLAEDYNEACLV